MNHLRVINRLFLLATVCTAFGCAKGTLTESAETDQAAEGDKWRPIFVSKSDIGRSGVELAVELIELAPGETPDQAAMRVFGRPAHGNVAALIDGEGGPLDRAPESAEPDAQGVCNDACRFANDGVCDEPRYCATGTDCGDCNTSGPSQPGESPSAPPPSSPGPVGNQCLDTCRYANDGVCDVPDYCGAGTDCSDCGGRGAAPAAPEPVPTPQPAPNGCDDSCRYANDGVCDVPDYCPAGSDCSDCGGRQPASPQPAQPAQPGQPAQPQPNPSGCDDSCRYANDGVCDVPDYCAAGSDCSDCGGRSGAGQPEAAQPQPEASAGPDSCRYANDGECDVPQYCAAGTDTSDCSGGASASPNPNPAPSPAPANGPDSCRWAHDGACDEPDYCAAGTDTSDCRGGGPVLPNPQPNPAPQVGPDSCRWAHDNVCDEPQYCAAGTDTSDCRAGGLGQPGPPAGGGNANPNPGGGACSDSCVWANDGACDEPNLCSPGTDCGDCGVGTWSGVLPKSQPDLSKKRPEKVTFDACFAEGHEGVCRPDVECAGRAVAGLCPGGSDYRCCLPVGAEPTSKPGQGQRCDTEGFVGLCVSKGQCGAVGLSGPCGAGLQCCAEDGVKEKAAITGSIALVAVGTRALVFAYRAYRAYRTVSTAVGVVQTLNSRGQSVQVEVTTNSGSINRARNGAFPDGRAVSGSQGVGALSNDYFTDRTREAAAENGMTCSPATRQQMNDQKNYNCKQSGPRFCPRKAPGEQGGISCAEIQTRLSRGSRCVNDRRRLNDVCFGGLGHPDDANQRGAGDPPLNDDIQAVRRCQEQLAQHCGGR